jgi:putative transposase
LDVLVQSRRNSQAAARLMRKLIRRHGLPRVMTTGKLKSFGGQ